MPEATCTFCKAGLGVSSWPASERASARHLGVCPALSADERREARGVLRTERFDPDTDSWVDRCL